VDLVCLIPNPNDISSRVNNCLGFFFTISCFVAQPESQAQRERSPIDQEKSGRVNLSSIIGDAASSPGALGPVFEAMLVV